MKLKYSPSGQKMLNLKEDKTIDCTDDNQLEEKTGLTKIHDVQ